MNEIYKREADIYLSFRLQLMCKFFVCGLLYATAFPALYIAGCIMFAAAGWIDRYNFLRVWAPPPPTSDRLIALVARVIVPLAIMLHTYMALFFFRAIDIQRNTGWSLASILAAVAIGLTTPLLVYFLISEHSQRLLGSRKVGPIVPAHRLRTFREWFLDLREEEGTASGRGSSWRPTETFRETTLEYYEPRIPRALLQDGSIHPHLHSSRGSLSSSRLSTGGGGGGGDRLGEARPRPPELSLPEGGFNRSVYPLVEMAPQTAPAPSFHPSLEMAPQTANPYSQSFSHGAVARSPHGGGAGLLETALPGAPQTAPREHGAREHGARDPPGSADSARVSSRGGRWRGRGFAKTPSASALPMDTSPHDSWISPDSSNHLLSTSATDPGYLEPPGVQRARST